MQIHPNKKVSPSGQYVHPYPHITYEVRALLVYGISERGRDFTEGKKRDSLDMSLDVEPGENCCPTVELGHYQKSGDYELLNSSELRVDGESRGQTPFAPQKCSTIRARDAHCCCHLAVALSNTGNMDRPLANATTFFSSCFG